MYTDLTELKRQFDAAKSTYPEQMEFPEQKCAIPCGNFHTRISLLENAIHSILEALVEKDRAGHKS